MTTPNEGIKTRPTGREKAADLTASFLNKLLDCEVDTMKYFNRLKYWLFVRRFHIDGIRFESNGNSVDVIAVVNGNSHVIETIKHLDGISSGVTDYGIAKIAQRAI